MDNKNQCQWMNAWAISTQKGQHAGKMSHSCGASGLPLPTGMAGRTWRWWLARWRTRELRRPWPRGWLRGWWEWGVEWGVEWVKSQGMRLEGEVSESRFGRLVRVRGWGYHQESWFICMCACLCVCEQKYLDSISVQTLRQFLDMALKKWRHDTSEHV